MTNRDTGVARDFHDRTAHSPHSVRASGHGLDWDSKPFLFKIYPNLPEVALPNAFDPPPVDALEALWPHWDPLRARAVTLESLAAVLFFSAGVTKRRNYPGGAEIHFRAAPSTGALYQTEVYAVLGAVDGIPAGVYHFSPGDFRLRRLREGDYRSALASAASDPDVARRPVTLILSAIYWRNTWKYQARAYRHLFWDSGTMLANFTAAAGALGLAPRVLAGFVDADVNRLLGLDPDREAALELVPLGPIADEAPPAPAVGPLDPAVIPLSSAEVDYPLLRQIHQASMLEAPEAVGAWRRAEPLPPREARGTLRALPEPRRAAGHPFAETVLRRGSTRQFSHASLDAAELSTALAHATRQVPADFPPGLVEPHLVVNAVEGVEPGAYRYWPEPNGLELLRASDFRVQSAYLCLEQALGGDAAATIYFLAPLDAILARWGNRGYRLANLAAGLAGGRAYLAAYAQGFGASGLTFYDADVVRFFAPHATGLDAVFVTALGRSATARARAD